VIGSNPARFRALMIPGMLEKFGYCATLVVLYAQGRITATDLQPLWPDFMIGLLFVAAFVKTRASSRRLL